MTGAASAAIGAMPRDAPEVAEAIRAAARDGTALRIVGRGRWSGANSPAARTAANAATLSVAGMTGVVAYVPADLTLTVRAGTTLADLNAITAEHSQWCPLLAWGDDDGTVGATFATATTGPCSAALGRPRDLALGVEFVDGTGTIAKGGGRVVKNVAGFDLTRLMVGAFGTLGVITEVTMRLRARPVCDVSVCVTSRGTDGAALAGALRRADVQPIAIELIDARLAPELGLHAGTVIARFGGNRGLVDAGRSAAARIGDVTEVDANVWTRLRALDPHPRRFDAMPVGTVAHRIRQRFDPAGVLNPGILGGGR